jgi:hypothetical protein
VCVGQQQCECTEADGPCCDGCLFKPQGTECGMSDSSIFDCVRDQCGASYTITKKQFVCDGTSAACPETGGSDVVTDQGQCNANQVCTFVSSPRCADSTECP